MCVPCDDDYAAETAALVAADDGMGTAGDNDPAVRAGPIAAESATASGEASSTASGTPGEASKEANGDGAAASGKRPRGGATQAGRKAAKRQRQQQERAVVQTTEACSTGMTSSSARC